MAKLKEWLENRPLKVQKRSIEALEIVNEELVKRIEKLEKEGRTRGIKARLDRLEKQMEDIKQGIDVLNKLEKELHEALNIQRANETKYEKLQEELNDYWNFNK